MDWLNGNAIWVLVAIAGLWFFLRRGGRHRQARGDMRQSDGGAAQPSSGNAPAASGAALDPVSGNPVRTDRAVTAAFGGRAYYFESEESRRRFEAEPQKFAEAAPLAKADRPRRRRGC